MSRPAAIATAAIATAAIATAAIATAGLAAALVLGAAGGDEARKEAPRPVEARGRLVCLAEEVRERFRAEVPPVHEHILALRLEKEAAVPLGPAGAAYLTILRTPLSEALFADERFRAHTLVLTGRVFPGTDLCEVSRIQWVRDSKLLDVYYWCEVCSIRGVNPGPCACCQGAVELREAPVEGSPPKK